MQETNISKADEMDQGVRLRCPLEPTQGELKLSKLFHTNNDQILRPRNSVWDIEAASYTQALSKEYCAVGIGVRRVIWRFRLSIRFHCCSGA